MTCGCLTSMEQSAKIYVEDCNRIERFGNTVRRQGDRQQQQTTRDRPGEGSRSRLPQTGRVGMISRVRGYNCYPGSGWRSYGRLIINFHNGRVTSIFFNGDQIF